MTISDVEKIFDIIQIIELIKGTENREKKSDTTYMCAFTRKKNAYVWSPPSMELSRQEYWSGQPFSSPGDLPDPGIKFMFPALRADYLSPSHQGNPHVWTKTN